MPIDLLSARDVPGYPNLRVSLFVEQQGENENYAVVIRDHVRITEWEPTTRKEAADRYLHPFCFGYEYPSSIVPIEDDGA